MTKLCQYTIHVTCIGATQWLIVVCKSTQIVSDYILACMCSSIGQDTSLMICDHIDRHSVVDSCLLFSFVNLLLMWLSVYLLPSAAVVTESVMKWWSVQVIVFSLPSVVDCCLFYFVAYVEDERLEMSFLTLKSHFWLKSHFEISFNNTRYSYWCHSVVDCCM